MSRKVILTAAVTGNLTTPRQTPFLPITPDQIAEACLGAAEAGAAIAHVHVRNPENGEPSTALELYQETVDRIRHRIGAVILNVTTGPGGRFVPGDPDPRQAGPGTTLSPADARVRHIPVLKPEICTLDLNTMNSGAAVVINTPASVRRMAGVIRAAGVKPEIELFDSGDIALMNDLIAERVLAPAPLVSIVMGVKYGFQPSVETVAYARGLLPPSALFTAFGVGRSAFPAVAMSVLAGGHARIGLEDAVYLDRGQLARSNAEMVAKAARIISDLGFELATATEARSMLSLE